MTFKDSIGHCNSLRHASVVNSQLPKIIVSACLLGEPVRFDGRSSGKPRKILMRWQKLGCLIPVCPEMLGGLGVPRPPAERVHHRVLTVDGQDVTRQFQRGAAKTLALAKENDCRMAILKAKSPSCGRDMIYSGQFDARLIPGNGVTVEVLQQAGIRIFTEAELSEAYRYWKRLQAPHHH